MASGHRHLVQVVSEARKPWSSVQTGYEAGTSCELVFVTILSQHMRVAVLVVLELVDPEFDLVVERCWHRFVHCLSDCLPFLLCIAFMEVKIVDRHE